MRNYIFLLFRVFILSLLAVQSASAQTVPEEPIHCKVGYYIKTIRINQAEETFDAMFYFWLRVDSIDVDKDYSLVKDIEFINADAEMEIDTEIIDSANRYFYAVGRCKATIPYKSYFRDFPFDVQSLKISLENTVYNAAVVNYVPDALSNNINDMEKNSIDILNGDQYFIKALHLEPSSYTYSTNFGDPAVKGFDKYSRLEFVVEVKRNPIGILQKIAIPLLVVLTLAYLVFFIPDYEIGTASALTVTALLAAIAFQWTLNDSLPKVSYLTLIDKIFYLVYLYIFYAMAQTVVTFNLYKLDDHKKEISERIEWHSRYLFPITFVLFFLWIIYG